MDLQLKDKVVLVTGGHYGLGKSISLSLAAEGAKVGINFRNFIDQDPEKADALVAEIKEKYGIDALPVHGDVTKEEDVIAMYDELEAKFGPVDALINNAAFCPTGASADLPVELFTLTWTVNVTGTFLCSRELVKRLRAADRPGRIVSISSQAAFRGSQSGKTAYDSSKMGIIGFTISLAREMAPHGIGVNCVTPGLMYTDMIADAIDKDPEKFNSRVPIGRIGKTEEIADVAVFLASERASYMTGATVDVSGGLAMH